MNIIICQNYELFPVVFGISFFGIDLSLILIIKVLAAVGGVVVGAFVAGLLLRLLSLIRYFAPPLGWL